MAQNNQLPAVQHHDRNTRLGDLAFGAGRRFFLRVLAVTEVLPVSASRA
jgi:hypothetical protein